MGARLLVIDGFDDPLIAGMACTLAEAIVPLGGELVLLAGDTRKRAPFLTLPRPDPRRSRAFACTGAPAAADVDLEMAFRSAGGGRAPARAAVEREIACWFAEAHRMYAAVAPDVVIVWNGLLHVRRAYAQVARDLDLPLLFAEKGLLPGSFLLDPEGVGPQSRLARTPIVEGPRGEVGAVPDDAGRATVAGSGWPQPPRQDLASLRRTLGLDGTRKVVFFPAQVERDSNILLFSPNFPSCAAALRWCVEGLPPDYSVLVKPHPKGESSVRTLQDIVGPRGVVTSSLHVLDAIALADLVVTVNSAVGLEAALAGKPVLTLGRSMFDGKGFTTAFLPGATAEHSFTECLYEHQAEPAEQKRRAHATAALHADLCLPAGDADRARQVLSGLLSVQPVGPERLTLAEAERALTSRLDVSRLARRLRRHASGLVRRSLSRN